MIGFPKPVSRLLSKLVRQRKQRSLSAAVKRAVQERDDHTCRVCGKRSQSVHEMRPVSIGGEVALKNCIAVCGSGTTGCHGKLQRHELIPIGGSANGHLRFRER